MSEQYNSIEVPVIEITDGFTVDDIETEDDCDDAFALLTAAIASIEAKLDEIQHTGLPRGDDYRRTKAALRFKKAGLQVVSSKRGKLKRAKAQEEKENNIANSRNRQRKLVHLFKLMYPDQFAECVRRLDVEKICEE